MSEDTRTREEIEADIARFNQAYFIHKEEAPEPEARRFEAEMAQHYELSQRRLGK